MSPFQLNEEQRLLRQTARQFAREVLRPTSLQVERDKEEVPSRLIQQMAEVGLRGLDIPAEYGGRGLDAVTCGLVIEELVYGWFSASTYAVNLGSGPILYAGSEEQKKRFLPGLCRSNQISAFAVTEPDAGSDAAAITTFASRNGSGYVINGRKMFITNAHRADIMVVFARTEINPAAGKGISLFVIEKGTAGVTIGRRFWALAHEANPIWEVSFDDCQIPSENRLGEEGEAFRYIQKGFAKSRALYGAKCVGHAQAALDYALHYAQGRRQFGKPISSFQGIRFKVADLLTKIEAARLLTYRACGLADAGTPDAPAAAAMAKHFSSNVAVEVASEAIQIMGGHGYTREHPLERYYREAKLFQIGDGSSEVLRILISRFANARAAEHATVRIE